MNNNRNNFDLITIDVQWSIGWVHESNETNKFDENNFKFWNSLNLKIRHLPNRLPIETFFCHGFGYQFFEYGQCLDQFKWTNNLMFQLQLNCDFGQISTEDSFIGGSCLSFSEFNKPILKANCDWTTDLFILIIFKYSTTDDKFDDKKDLIILGHNENGNVCVGDRIEMRSVL